MGVSCSKETKMQTIVWSIQSHTIIDFSSCFLTIIFLQIGQSQVPAVSQYVQNQRENHKQQTFQDEFRALCHKYDVEFDERYCWD